MLEVNVYSIWDESIVVIMFLKYLIFFLLLEYLSINFWEKGVFLFLSNFGVFSNFLCVPINFSLNNMRTSWNIHRLLSCHVILPVQCFIIFKWFLLIFFMLELKIKKILASSSFVALILRIYVFHLLFNKIFKLIFI